MRITKFQVKDYRACTSTKFEPNEHLSVLIGPNGSGKSTILSAIRLATAVLERPPRRRLSADFKPTSEVKVWYEWNEKSILQTINLDIATNERNQDEILESAESWYMFDVTGSRKQIQLPIEYYLNTYMHRGRRDLHWQFPMSARDGEFPVDVRNAVNEVRLFASKIRYYSASQFTNPSNCPVSFEVEQERIQHRIQSSGHKGLLHDMYEEYVRNHVRFLEYESIVGPGGIGLIESIEFKTIDTSSPNYSVNTGGRIDTRERTNKLVIPIFKILGNQLSPNQLSEGTFRCLALIFYIVTDNSSMLLIEEPEVCVHHGILSSLVELLKDFSKTKQVVITTHSDSILDCLGIDNIYKVKRDSERGIQVAGIAKTMKKKELSALREYLKNEGNLGEYWKHGRLEDE